MHALIENGAVVKYPYGVGELRRDHPNTSFPSSPDDEAFAAFSAYRVYFSTPPQYDDTTQVLKEGTPVFDVEAQRWTQVWNVRPMTPEEASARKAALIASYEAALDAHLDAKASERRYNDRFTCALRAGFQGPYQAEGLAFAQWMDACNAYAFAQIALIESGQRKMPTVEDFIAELPPLQWPAQPE